MKEISTFRQLIKNAKPLKKEEEGILFDAYNQTEDENQKKIISEKIIMGHVLSIMDILNKYKWGDEKSLEDAFQNAVMEVLLSIDNYAKLKNRVSFFQYITKVVRASAIRTKNSLKTIPYTSWDWANIHKIDKFINHYEKKYGIPPDKEVLMEQLNLSEKTIENYRLVKQIHTMSYEDLEADEETIIPHDSGFEDQCIDSVIDLYLEQKFRETIGDKDYTLFRYKYPSGASRFKTNKEVANYFSITERTVQNRLKRIKEKILQSKELVEYISMFSHKKNGPK